MFKRNFLKDTVLSKSRDFQEALAVKVNKGQFNRVLEDNSKSKQYSNKSRENDIYN
jgi:hypothetical protein